MKILVTGGAGYIGSIMTKRLLDEGFDVVVADSLERGYEDAIPKGAQFLKGDLLNNQFVEELFKNNTINAVIHFAGYISMAESMENPSMYFTNNVYASLHLLEQMRKHDVANFIFSSTAGVYGNPQQVPIPEDHPKNPTNPYGESKLMVEKMLSWYNSIFHINFMALRYFNACGATLDGMMGERHNPETHIIPNAIKAVLNNTEFRLFGTDYDTFDGTAVRDYIHVLDLVEAHVSALKKLSQTPGGYYYNIGTGIGHSNKEIVDMVQKISGVMLKITNSPRRSGDADKLVADSTKAKNDLSFSPQYSDLETIIKTSWEWHRKSK